MPKQQPMTEEQKIAAVVGTLEERIVWLVACALLTRGGDIDTAADVADDVLTAYRARFLPIQLDGTF